MELPDAMSTLKKELANFLKIMGNVPGIEEYQREVAELKALDRKADELVSLTAQQEQLHRANLQARAAAEAAKVAEAAAAAKIALPAAQAAPYFAKEQALDPAEMTDVIKRLMAAVSEAHPDRPDLQGTLGNVWELESVDWMVDAEPSTPAPAQPPAPPRAPEQPRRPAAQEPPDQDRSIGGSWSD